MREIKFRGKSLMGNSEGTWIYSNGIDYGDDVKLVYGDNETSDFWIYVDKDTVGQFTGLHDKNGKKIYEGDIVRDTEVYLTHQLYVKQGIEDIEKAEKYRCFGDVAVVEFCTEEIASCGCCYQEFVGTGFKAKKVNLTCCEVIR